MNRFLSLSLSLFLLLFLSAAVPARAMDGGDAIRLVRSGADENVILATARQSNFRMAAGDMASLRSVGASEYLVQGLCGASRPMVTYSAPVMVYAGGAAYVDKKSTLFEIHNRSGSDLSAEINHDARRIVLRHPGYGGLHLPNGGLVRLTVGKGTWKVRFEGYNEDGEVKMRGGERTLLTLEPRTPRGGLAVSVDDSERVRVYTLIPETAVIVTAPAPVVMAPPPVVVRQPTVVVERNPVVVTPAPIIRPGPMVVRHAPPPMVVTPAPYMPPVVVPARAPAPARSGININFSYNAKKR